MRNIVPIFKRAVEISKLLSGNNDGSRLDHQGIGSLALESVPVGPFAPSCSRRTGSRAACSIVCGPSTLQRSVAVKSGHAVWILTFVDSSSIAKVSVIVLRGIVRSTVNDTGHCAMRIGRARVTPQRACDTRCAYDASRRCFVKEWKHGVREGDDALRARFEHSAHLLERCDACVVRFPDLFERRA